MTTRFDPRQGLIVVRASLTGPTSRMKVRLALDTGATTTLINTATLVALGLDFAADFKRIEVTTGSGLEYVPQIRVNVFAALGKRVRNFLVLAHTLPPSAGIDGLIGLDFVRGHFLTIDLMDGTI